MGCDIHFYVEVLSPKGEWTLAPGQLAPCDHCGGTMLDPDNKYCGNCKKELSEHEPTTGKCWFDFTKLNPVPQPCAYSCGDGTQLNEIFYRGRDYELFGILSGVRGDAVEGFTQENRGMPLDPSPVLARDALSPDYHSHTWYTLKELQAHDWTRYEYMASFRSTINQMQDLAHDHEDVRAVFWYDN